MEQSAWKVNTVPDVPQVPPPPKLTGMQRSTRPGQLSLPGPPELPKPPQPPPKAKSGGPAGQPPLRSSEQLVESEEENAVAVWGGSAPASPQAAVASPAASATSPLASANSPQSKPRIQATPEFWQWARQQNGPKVPNISMPRGPPQEPLAKMGGSAGTAANWVPPPPPLPKAVPVAVKAGANAPKRPPPQSWGKAVAKPRGTTFVQPPPSHSGASTPLPSGVRTAASVDEVARLQNSLGMGAAPEIPPLPKAVPKADSEPLRQAALGLPEMPAGVSNGLQPSAMEAASEQLQPGPKAPSETGADREVLADLPGAPAEE